MTIHDSRADTRGAPSEVLLSRAAFVLIRSASACAAFCEHNEPATTHQVVAATESMRRLAARLASQSGISLLQAYAGQLTGPRQLPRSHTLDHHQPRMRR
ncbi:hypothetical protein [Candidatus Poriferisodalis multihospitum]|uniref:hypothetical protein n=1 Tax=Candidatus Poriferisodalis multihospitum TaxID=2983191 RepID=UPI002B25FA28|nr:hypothetical protein [Candidatus Poriferisodalis multihospitum]